MAEKPCGRLARTHALFPARFSSRFSVYRDTANKLARDRDKVGKLGFGQALVIALIFAILRTGFSPNLSPDLFWFSASAFLRCL